MEKTTVVDAERITLDRLLESRRRTSHDGLSRVASRRFHEARTSTRWGCRCHRSNALAEGQRILATAERYDLAGVFDGRAVCVCGIGTVCAESSPRSLEHARVLVDAVANDAARQGVEMALLFPQPGVANGQRGDFHPVPTTDLTLSVSEPTRDDGAPNVTVRDGEERDLAAIVAMGRARAARFRFHLDRDVDFVQYAITRQRWLIGPGSADQGQLHFVVADEGTTAAAYVIISVVGNLWTLEECGDRDPCGARVGALLQALLAREPGQPRPTIRAWLPSGFLPPQVTIASAVPAREVIGVRMLSGVATEPPLSSHDVLFWRNDLL